MALDELVQLGGGLAVLLSPVYLIVFLLKWRRTRSVRAAAGLAGVGVVATFGVAGLLVAAVAVAPTDGPSDDWCAGFGGVPQAVTEADGTPGTICVVGGD